MGAAARALIPDWIRHNARVFIESCKATLRAYRQPLPAVSDREEQLIAQQMLRFRDVPAKEWLREWGVMLQQLLSGTASKFQAEWALNPVTFARQFNMAHGDANALQAQAVARG